MRQKRQRMLAPMHQVHASVLAVVLANTLPCARCEETVWSSPVFAAKSHRTCKADDWEYAIGECDVNQNRHVFAYARTDGVEGTPICDTHQSELPIPVGGVNCRHTCEAGSHLDVDLLVGGGIKWGRYDEFCLDVQEVQKEHPHMRIQRCESQPQIPLKQQWRFKPISKPTFGELTNAIQGHQLTVGGDRPTVMSSAEGGPTRRWHVPMPGKIGQIRWSGDKATLCLTVAYEKGMIHMVTSLGSAEVSIEECDPDGTNQDQVWKMPTYSGTWKSVGKMSCEPQTGKPEGFVGKFKSWKMDTSGGHTLDTCKSLCEQKSNCQAIDFYPDGGKCMQYKAACSDAMIEKQGVPEGRHYRIMARSKEEVSLVPRCKLCPSGRFSLGGGELVSGESGDWLRPWPKGMRTWCSYTDPITKKEVVSPSYRTASWRLLIAAPDKVKGTYDLSEPSPLASGRKIDGFPASKMVLVGGNHKACSDFHIQSADASAFVVLAGPGGCTVAEKVKHLTSYGAKIDAIIIATASYDATLQIPADEGADGGLPTNWGVPVFMISRGEYEILRQVLLLQDAKADILPPSESVAKDGCRPWHVEPNGKVVTSGENKQFDSMTSTLAWDVYLVRPGHVIFKYEVSSEEKDGMQFIVNDNTAIPHTHDAKNQEFRMDLGLGIQELKWVYTKDAAKSAGDDRAKVTLVEVVGTDYADLNCRTCHGASDHNGVGQELCSQCDAGFYMPAEYDNPDGKHACMPCEKGYSAPKHSIGSRACRKLGPCTSRDLEIKYGPCANGKQQKDNEWKYPPVCDPDQGGKELKKDSVQVDCFPCNPGYKRPDAMGGRNICLPERKECPKETRALRHYKVLYWYEMPHNCTSQLWTSMDNTDGATTVRSYANNMDYSAYEWRLHPEGQFIFVGDDGMEDDTKQLTSVVSGGGFFAEASLHFDVETTEPGRASFLIDICPLAALHNQAHLEVDGRRVTKDDGLLVFPLSGSKVKARVVFPLEPGLHRLTWLWSFPAIRGGDTDSPPAEGLRLRSMTLEHAKDAGDISCDPCPAGFELIEGEKKCVACKPGWHATRSMSKCAPCEADTYAATNATEHCITCGYGSHTNGKTGQAHCAPLPKLGYDADPKDPKTASAGLGVNMPDLQADMKNMLRNSPEGYSHVVGPMFSAGGRAYYISPFVPEVFTKGADPLPGFIWEDPVVLGGDACIAGTDDKIPTYQWGTTLYSARAVKRGDATGIELVYANGEVCVKDEGQENIQEDTRHTIYRTWASLFLKCDPSESHTERGSYPVDSDIKGLYHVSRFLKEVVPPAGIGPPNISGICPVLALELATAAACPECSADDFHQVLGLCEDNGKRWVHWERSRPCKGGYVPPEKQREYCQESGSMHPMSIVALGFFSALAALVAASLCGYAYYLHNKYGKYVEPL